MFTFNNSKVFQTVLGDPGADDKQIHIFRAPEYLTIKNAYLVCQDAQGAGSAGAFELQNWGTAGTAIKSSGGTIAAAVGGTSVAARIAAATPEAFTISSDRMAAGEWMVLDYQETGDFVEANVTLVVEYVPGVASAAS